MDSNIQNNNSTTVKSTIKKGISFGSCLAMIISYTAWGSIPWAIFHGLLSWLYIIYYYFNYV
ncbi:hypothetical protein [uncultured Clostridium sp.]|uniref:hypothetical protein n=1 Tax=uncultured Clostridium sp. TaxID=59620 RepID=UPI002607DD24|nr:hypothetical protein [uncultured Clostridium sp.]